MSMLIAMSARNAYHDLRAVPGPRTDLERAAHRLGSFPHCDHTETQPSFHPRDLRRIKALSVVRNRHYAFSFSGFQRYCNASGLGMLRDVVERLLRNAEKRDFDLRR